MDRPNVSIYAEQAVLGAILLRSEGFGMVSEILAPTDFVEPLHVQIFEAAEELHRQGQPTDVVLIAQCFNHQSVLDDGQTLNEYLAKLCASNNVATQADLPGLAQYLREQSRFRKLVALMDKHRALASSVGPVAKASDIATSLMSELDTIASQDVSPKLRATTIENAAREALAEAIAIREGFAPPGAKTGFRGLDEMIGALQPGEGSLIAGRPSMGKTALALSIARNVACAGGGVLYVSLEMDARALARRIMSMTAKALGSGIPYARVAHGAFSQADQRLLDRASAEIDRLPLIIEQQPGLTTSQIQSRARLAKRKLAAEGVGLQLILVDHLGLVTPSGRYTGTRTLEIGEISAAMHHMARELDVHVMALCQLSRNVETRPDKRPLLSDLRDSGELEQNADVVITVYREAYYLDRSSDPAEVVRGLEVENDLELGVLKNRAGPTGRVKLWVDMPCNFVTDIQVTRGKS